MRKLNKQQRRNIREFCIVAREKVATLPLMAKHTQKIGRCKMKGNVLTIQPPKFKNVMTTTSWGQPSADGSYSFTIPENLVALVNRNINKLCVHAREQDHCNNNHLSTSDGNIIAADVLCYNNNITTGKESPVTGILFKLVPNGKPYALVDAHLATSKISKSANWRTIRTKVGRRTNTEYVAEVNPKLVKGLSLPVTTVESAAAGLDQTHAIFKVNNSGNITELTLEAC